jgi:hypothetical protein
MVDFCCGGTFKSGEDLKVVADDATDVDATLFDDDEKLNTFVLDIVVFLLLLC